MKTSGWKWLLLAGLVSWSLMVVLPLDRKVTYGLDLRGGSSFVLEVQTDGLDEDARRDAPERALEILRNRVNELGIAETSVYRERNTQRIVVQIPGLEAEQRQQAEETLQRAAFLEFKLVHEDSRRLVDDFLDQGLAPPGYKVVTTDGIKYLVRDPSLDPPGATEESLRESLRAFRAPPRYELMLVQRAHPSGAVLYVPYLVQRRNELSGEHIVNAGVQQDTGKLIPAYVVTLEFDATGRRRFGQLTKNFAPFGERNPSPEGRLLAIVLDGRLYSAPQLRTPIYNGRAQVEGDFTFKDAQQLALVLRAGSLPAPVQVVDKRVVDPTLGRDSIESGKRAILIGGATVLVFMAGYYLLAGMVANVALILDMVLLPLGMMVAAGVLGLFTGAGTWTGAISLPTLTLAGIAGIALTIGMAVDANVLIFERIREEQLSGKRLRSAVDAGYDKAFSTILDANVTTLLTAAILFWRGSGPIRGFAITLTAGILVSMYVALVVTRMLFDLLTASGRITRLRMLSLFKNTRIDFLRYGRPAAALSLAVIALTWGLFIARGERNFGVDFTGGDTVTFLAEPGRAPAAETVRARLAAQGLSGLHIQFQQDMVGETPGQPPDAYVEVKSSFGQGAEVARVLNEAFLGQGFQRLVKEDSVGPQVGQELRRQGIWSIVFALIGMVIYITLRFEFGFAMGAIVALVHDVLITVGVFCLFGRPLSLVSVASVLTIVGYSVNDTIVIFDRIREDLGLYKGRPFREIANLSINQTLSRTVLTSLTTLITVVALLVLGGGAMQEMALTLFIGILAGTYSTIYIATPVAMLWHREKPAAAAAVPAGRGR